MKETYEKVFLKKYGCTTLFEFVDVCMDFDMCLKILNEYFNLQQERNNYKELYEKEKEKWEALKYKIVDLFNRSQNVCYLNVLEAIQKIELQDILKEVE